VVVLPLLEVPLTGAVAIAVVPEPVLMLPVLEVSLTGTVAVPVEAVLVAVAWVVVGVVPELVLMLPVLEVPLVCELTVADRPTPAVI
jgi:hypothetical protein